MDKRYKVLYRDKKVHKHIEVTSSRQQAFDNANDKLDNIEILNVELINDSREKQWSSRLSTKRMNDKYDRDHAEKIYNENKEE